MFEHLVRKNVRDLAPYSSARDEFTGEAEIFLDANENPFPFPYHRYPDPNQTQLKQEIAGKKKLNPGNLFLGNGSDEIIDLFMRAFCEPHLDTILTCAPGYGMYSVSAAVNAVNIRYFYLDENFQFQAKELLNVVQESDKLIFLCSPNNPSGNCIPIEDIRQIAKNFKGILIIDEAYIDFSEHLSASWLLAEFPNIAVLQTFSKAYASAGLRIGMGIMHKELIAILNKIKPPYNVSQSSQTAALQLLKSYDSIQSTIRKIQQERDRLSSQLTNYSFVKKVFPSDANFLLVRVNDAGQLYRHLMEEGIIVRNRSKLYNCKNCLRITVGTPHENQKLLQALNIYP